MSAKQPLYGGQAVIEGVMMGGKLTTVTAVRKKNGAIEYFEVIKETKPWISGLKKLPVLRGIAAIVEASALGTKHLNFASETYEEDQKTEEEKAAEKLEEKKESRLTMIFGLAVVGILSFIFAQLIFNLGPAVLAKFLWPIFPGKGMQILIEGIIKIILLLAYIYFISLTPLIKRVFQYHGAEHKVINTFEAGAELTVEQVKKHSRLHYRCGSSFILFTAVVSIVLYMFFPVHPLWVRLLTRILLIPVVLGLSFEVLQFSNKMRNVPVLKGLGSLGLLLQLLTTKEPDGRQIEVAILAFNEMRKREALMEKPEQPQLV